MVKDGGMEGDVPGQGWAAPGSPAEPGGASGWAPVDAPVGPGAPGGAGPARVVSTSGVVGDLDRPTDVPQVVLRPMTLADVLDGGFSVIKARPKRILTLTAAIVVPIQVLTAFVSRDLSGGLFGSDDWFREDPTVSGQTGSSSLDLVALLAALILPSVALVCIAAAISHLVMGWTVGHDASGREMIGVVGRRWWPLLATFVVVHVAEVIGVLTCYLATLPIMAFFVVVAPVIGAEEASTGTALRRSFDLVKNRFWPVLGIALLMGIVAFTLGNVLSVLPQGAALVVGIESGWWLAALGATIGQMVTTPFVAAATTLLYLDLRIRTEGMDIELAARRAIDRVG
jgi:hypothetical protein